MQATSFNQIRGSHCTTLKIMTIRRLAKASGTLVLACGTSPCYSFTIGPVVHLPYPGRSSVGSNGVVRPRPRWAISAVSAQDVVAATALTDGGSGGPEARTNRRWIHDVKTGDKVIGYVADTTGFAAFVDVGVVRHGSKVSSSHVMNQPPFHTEKCKDHIEPSNGASISTPRAKEPTKYRGTKSRGGRY